MRLANMFSDDIFVFNLKPRVMVYDPYSGFLIGYIKGEN